MIESMSAKRHILWGGLVGALAAFAFSLLLAFQFDADLTIGFVASTVPICAVLGGGFGWIWWKWIARWFSG